MRARGESGFTLLEVVIAFVVLALVLSTVFQIFSTGLARAGDMEEQGLALSIAQSALAAAGVENGVAEGETQGESGDRRYRWVVKIARYEEQPAPDAPNAAAPQSTFSLYRVDVAVQWSAADGRARDLHLAKLQLGPRVAP